jgi:hypothetical protein
MKPRIIDADHLLQGSKPKRLCGRKALCSVFTSMHKSVLIGDRPNRRGTELHHWQHAGVARRTSVGQTSPIE